MDGNDEKAKDIAVYFYVKIRPLIDGNIFSNNILLFSLNPVKIRPLMDGNYTRF